MTYIFSYIKKYVKFLHKSNINLDKGLKYIYNV